MKKKILSFAFALFAAVALLVGCSSDETKIITVGSRIYRYYSPETGEQECFLVKSPESKPWDLFLGTIEGFDYEPGNEYVIKVKIKTIEDPSRDVPKAKYSLVKVISKEQRTSDNMPADMI